MRRYLFHILWLVPLLASACSSPTAPASAAAASPVPSVRGVSLGLTIVPDSDSVNGFHSPMSVTLRAYEDGVGPAVIQSAVFKMLDDQGRVLAQAAIAAGDPLPKDGYLEGNVVVQTLSWLPENGRGRSIGGSLTTRSASGELRTLALSIPAR